ncbi:DUF3307 domain-containing protein [Actinomadura sp. NPDC047616]|uniref:DUF3307 domain-containing protein n=1 Tax=Actinomadura sp. NPDC047616 TaxID=3155914 RepID=UPI0033F8AD74
MTATAYAVTLATLIIAHHVADHWLQTNHQATHKARPTLQGHLANLRHVGTHTATLAGALLLVAWQTGTAYRPGYLAAGLAVNAITHYVADRRVHLDRLARLWPIRKGGWIDHDRYALYHLDQSWHLGWLLITALIIT